ncbi:MAG: CHAT domain-containing protein [Deltaproteobacteria bacterium]|nr:CHAT domain-containing protein [Deltaproteobacteria bacterium]
MAIQKQSDGSYRSLVLDGAVGAHSGCAFEPPFGPEEIKDILLSLAGQQGQGIFSGVTGAVGSDGRREVGRPKVGKRVDLESVGKRLYDALFQGDVKESFDRSLERARATRPCRLVLRLVFGFGDRSPDYLASFPWDLLHDPDASDFLVLGDEVSLARQLRVPDVTEPDLEGRNLRVLGVMAQPAGMSSLRLYQEWEAIKEVTKTSPKVEVELFDRATVEELRDRLDRGRFDCLHFMGHGDLEGIKGVGELFFVTAQGSPSPISGPLLATNLRNLPSLQLVVLNACNGAAFAFGKGMDPFLGVASSLLREKIHAVVGMQTSISDRSAKHFSTGFFRALGRGCPLETALFEGRLEILNRDRREGGAWAVPTLFKARSRRDRAPSDGSVPVPELPREKSEGLLEEGLRRFRNGNTESSRIFFRKAMVEDPTFDWPRLYLSLIAMTERAPALMGLQRAHELSRSLAVLVGSEEEAVKSLAKILLYLVNHDFYEQKGIKPMARSVPFEEVRQARGLLSKEQIKSLSGVKKSRKSTLLLELPMSR